MLRRAPAVSHLVQTNSIPPVTADTAGTASHGRQQSSHDDPSTENSSSNGEASQTLLSQPCRVTWGEPSKLAGLVPQGHVGEQADEDEHEHQDAGVDGRPHMRVDRLGQPQGPAGVADRVAVGVVLGVWGVREGLDIPCRSVHHRCFVSLAAASGGVSGCGAAQQQNFVWRLHGVPQVLPVFLTSKHLDSDKAGRPRLSLPCATKNKCAALMAGQQQSGGVPGFWLGVVHRYSWRSLNSMWASRP